MIIKANYKLENLFTTPVLVGYFENIENLNNELKSLFLSFEKQPEKYKNKNSFNTNVGNLFDSHFDLFKIDEPAVQQLKKLMLNVLRDWLGVCTELSVEEISSIEFNHHSWFHISREGAYKALHNHPSASWSMVYYVDQGDINVNDRSGYIQFFDPRFAANMHQDVSNYKLKREYRHEGISYRPQNSMFVLFPSYMYHDVIAYTGKKPRINVAANFWVD